MAGSILIVLEPATTYDLMTLETAKAELGITDNVQDDKIKAWIEDTSAMVADYLGRVLALERVQETFRPSNAGSEALRLSRRPVTEIETVTVSGVPMVAADWQLDAAKGLLYRTAMNYFTASRTAPFTAMWGGPVVVTYSGGYALLDGLPRGISQATVTMLRHRWSVSSSNRDPFVRSEDIDGVARVDYWSASSQTASGNAISSALPPEAAGMLDRYRDIEIA